jgi:hypothetical protein
VGQGINWASSLELSYRLIAWCWALVLFRGSPALDPDLFVRMRASIEDQASHVEKYLSRYFSPNTHLTGEALGLFYAGTVFPELGRARLWRERGARILVEECTRQVFADGVYFEQSTCYQRYTVEIVLHFLILGARAGISVPSAVSERAQAMLDFLLAVRFPCGQVPSIGDADGGWLLPLTHRAPDDLRGVFSTAAALFGRADAASKEQQQIDVRVQAQVAAAVSAKRDDGERTVVRAGVGEQLADQRVDAIGVALERGASADAAGSRRAQLFASRIE